MWPLKFVELKKSLETFQNLIQPIPARKLSLQNRLTCEHKENCIKFKVTKDFTDIEQLEKIIQDQKSY